MNKEDLTKLMNGLKEDAIKKFDETKIAKVKFREARRKYNTAFNFYVQQFGEHKNFPCEPWNSCSDEAK